MAILNKWTQDFVSNGAEQTIRLGVRLGELLELHDLVCLSGELGAGKTALAQGIGRGWGAAQRVTSPTFTLVNEYPRLNDGRILYHIDTYRLESEEDAYTVGLDDIFDAPGAVMLEWPERVESWLPADKLWIAITYVSPTRRAMRFTASGDRSAALLDDFKRSAFGI